MNSPVSSMTLAEQRSAYLSAISTTRDALEGARLSLARRSGYDKMRAKARIASYEQDIASFQAKLAALPAN